MLNSIWDDDPVGYAALRECWLNTRRQLYIERYVGALRDGDVVLEIGSGTGNLLRSLAIKYTRLTFVGIEPLTPYVSFSNQQSLDCGLSNVKFLAGSGEEASLLVRDKCRLILTNDVLHHVDNQQALSCSLASVSDELTEWLAIEPNYLNMYTLYKQATAPGERNFFPSRFLANAAAWRLLRSRYLFLIPPFVKDPPPFIKIIERSLEWVPLLAGGVFLHLKLR